MGSSAPVTENTARHAFIPIEAYWLSPRGFGITARSVKAFPHGLRVPIIFPCD
jgi:hypothetical protein